MCISRPYNPGELEKKNGFPRWSEYYPTEYRGKQYESNYEYNMHMYELGDEYDTTYYGFGHSVFKNRKSVKRDYREPKKEKEKVKFSPYGAAWQSNIMLCKN